LGKADSVTEFDSEFESLSLQLENIKMATQKILAQVQSLVQPNPGHRIEDKVYSRLDRPKPHRTTPHELLSIELSRAGNAFGPETQYGESWPGNQTPTVCTERSGDETMLVLYAKKNKCSLGFRLSCALPPVV